MKTIKRIFIISFVLAGLLYMPAFAQEGRENRHMKRLDNNQEDEDSMNSSTRKVTLDGKNIKKVIIKDILGKISVVGSQLTSIVIEGEGLEEIPERAKGLKPLYGTGCIDNTGAGVAANESDGTLTLCGASKSSEDASYVFNLPKGVSVSIDYNSPFANENIEITDMEGEVEVSSLNGDIKCINVTGPLVLNSISGQIDVKISRLNQNGPTSISLISGDLDITLPVDSPANLEMNAITGGLYTDFDIKAETKRNNLPKVGGGSSVETKLNGGGVGLSLSSTSGNIYLRKK